MTAQPTFEEEFPEARELVPVSINVQVLAVLDAWIRDSGGELDRSEAITVIVATTMRQLGRW